MKRIDGISSWQIFQQTDGYADISFTYELQAPTAEEDIKRYKYIKNVSFRIREENTNMPVTPWVNSEITGELCGKCEIKNIPAGGLYYLETRLEHNEPYKWDMYPSVIVRHIGVGDIFLITGQSNAAGWSQGVLTDAPELGIGVLRKNNEWDLATMPLSNFHSPFMSFAKLLHKKLGYPIGLIPRAIGSSAIASWVDDGVNIGTVKSEYKTFYPKIKGILWYQGTTEATNSLEDTYYQQFMKFVGEIRGMFSDDKLPIFTFQLNRFTECNIKDNVNPGYTKLREIQRRIAKENEGIYIAPTIDCMKMSDQIHNAMPYNLIFGERLGYIALENLYHKFVGVHKYPEVISAVARGSELVVTLSNINGHIEMHGADAAHLPLCVTDGGKRIACTEYDMMRNTITMKLASELHEGAYLSAMIGADPQYIISDCESQLPLICFDGYKIDIM